MKFKKIAKLVTVFMLCTSIVTGCSSNKSSEKPADAPDTWIADRTIKGLIFQSANDASVDMNPEIQKYIKERTGITLELEGITAEDSQGALSSGLAAGNLPDFIAFYLNNSGREEMQMLLKAANEGQFTDLKPFMENSKTYSKYLDKDYLPADTRDNIMFRDDWDGSSYLMHMSINRTPAQVNRAYIGGTYIKKSITDDLGIDPASITTTDQLYDLAKKIKEKGYKDDNGAPITAIGPTAWGGSDRDFLYNDLVWSGDSSEKFFKDKDGNIKHEAQTEYGMKRVEYVQKLIKEGIMHPEFYTMNETRAKEGVVNGSFGIVADMHNFLPENNDMEYIPLGPISRVDGSNNMVLSYKSGYAGWAIPSTTKDAEEVFKFADWLASEEGKRLYFYGLEGRDYDLDENGNPVVKKEVIELKEKKPEEAKKLGFRGVGSYWGEHLGYTDLDNQEDFGEAEWGQSVKEEDTSAATKIIEMYDYDKKVKEASVIDGMTPKSFLYEFDGGKGDLEAALTRYNEDLERAYYAKSSSEAKKILDDSLKNLEKNGLSKFCEFLKEKEASGVTIKY
ncbi:extracellular solute-binding protein [Romboutsia weinsteinii]|uniref:Extracellular solute-binding protein n=1 Tax=Romboutsia weinsteinii TaxID=2020949 RepID=A0A371J2U0_9FIRM|nr:extracellular solute-binding protein [Romboutsia weinsteinii]RDY27099.1 extracellular solute-binding protein [Romboutsia weinsteinii]